MKIVIIKYNAGNIESVKNAIQRLGIECEITDDPQKIRQADKVIFPGVGEALTTMKYLKNGDLDKLIVSLKQPVLGICLGLQLMCKYTEEGNIPCLGIFDETVKRFIPEKGMEHITKVPHMGWNNITNLKSNLFESSVERKYVYFVHSFYATTGEDTIATGNYINKFSAALHKNNFYATQFHPEKSGPVGSDILQKFLDIKG